MLILSTGLPRLLSVNQGLGLLIAVIGAVALEYFGVIDLIPNFGKEAEVKSTSTSQPVKTIKPIN